MFSKNLIKYFKINRIIRLRASAARDEGFSLVVVLLFVGVITSLVVLMELESREARILNESRVAAWHLATVAKAARVYARDQSLPGGPLEKNVLAVAPQEITVGTLIGARLLPPDFNPVNNLGQPVRVFAGNFPVSGDPLDDDTVATAYVFLDQGGPQADAGMMQYVIEAAREYGVTASAPLFDEFGVNISDDCGVAPSTAIWDSGCLTSGEYAFLLGNPAAELLPGTLMIPAWRASDHDTRAVMRFPQPENPGYATMLTNLEMGSSLLDADGNCIAEVEVFSPSPEGSGVCDVEPDDSSIADWRDADRRVDFLNVGNMDVNRVILTDQPGSAEVEVSFTGDPLTPVYADVDGDERSIPGTFGDEVLNVTGNVDAMGGLQATGRRANPTDTPAIVTGPGRIPTISFSGDSTVDHNIVVGGNGNLRAASARSRTAEAAVSVRNSGPGASTTVGASDPALAYIGAQTTFAPALTVTPRAGRNEGVVSELLDAAALTVATGTADIFGRAQVNNIAVGTAGVSGLPFNTVAAEIVLQPGAVMTVNNDVLVEESMVITGAGTLTGQTRLERCFGGGDSCPDITLDPPSPCDGGLCD